MLAVREANIARNEEMLRALGFSTNTMLREDEKGATNADAGTLGQGSTSSSFAGNSTKTHGMSREEKRRRRQEEEADERAKLKSLVGLFVHRTEEIHQLWNYLDENFDQPPPLVVYGPTGCGKSDIVSSVVKSRRSPHVVFPCSGFASAKQLLKSLWYTMMLAVLENNDESPKAIQTSSSSIHASTAAAATRSSAMLGRSRLVGAMKAPSSFEDFIHSIGEAAKTHERHSRFRLTVLLDRFDGVDELEKGLARRLLRLSEFSHPGVRVLAVMRAPPPAGTAAGAGFVSLMFAPYTTHQIEDIIVHRMTSADRRLNRRVLFALLKKVLPRLCQLSRHVGELYASAAMVCDRARVELAAGDTTSAFPIAASAANEALNMPSLHMPATAATTNPPLLPSLSSSSLSLPARDGAPKPKRRRKDDNTTTGGGSGGEWLELAALSRVVDPHSLIGASSCHELAASWKYLVLAAFLASSNPKDTDDFVFAMKKKGKRRKERAGGGGKKGGGEDDIAGPKAFTFERLLSIFSQISIAGGGSGSGSSSRGRGKSSSALQVAKAVESRYGDAQLFAAVNDLEAQKYLTRASGWTLEKPLYVSAVQEGMARDISASVGFDLNAYLQ